MSTANTTAARPKKVAFLTAGGLAPCLSSAVGGLIERYTEIAPEIELIAYHSGYKGLLLGDSYKIGPAERAAAPILHKHGGSPIGNSRVKLTNVKDCVKRGLVKEGRDPQKVAADQLIADGVDILHTIGGDDTNTAAADLAAFLARNNYGLTVIGLPKTIDNDVFPIRQSLGAWTAAEQGARYFARAAAANSDDLRLIKSCTDLAVECALRRESGVIGHDEDRGGILRAIEFPRIKGGKPFDIATPWFVSLLASIGQPKGEKVHVAH
jgi:pyrophosphate--fructose-6-phosphate 1-phosphotransferase